MNFVRTLIRQAWKTKIHVGTDHLGNKYFEISEKAALTKGRPTKPKRICESPYSHVDYQEGMIPLEWEAWIRGKRKDPPTPEEIAKREQKMHLVKRQAQEFEEKDRERQLRDHREGLVAQPASTKQVGHASAPVYDKVDSAEPVSTGKTFEPSAWQPAKSASKEK